MSTEPHQPVRVLFVNDHLGTADGNIHGVTTWFHEVLKHLDHTQVNATLAILGRDHPYKNEMRSIGYPPVFFNRRKWDVRALFDLIRLIRRERIDILHLSAMKSMLLGRLAARLTGCRLLIHIHDSKRPPRLIALLQRLMVRRRDLAFLVSKGIQPAAMEQFGLGDDQIIVLRNAIDVDELSRFNTHGCAAIREEFQIPQPAVLFTCVGRLIPSKGHGVLIEAMGMLRQTAVDAKLLIVGSGPERNRLQTLVDRHNLAAHVHFTGQRHDIPQILNATDIFVMPSLGGEGLPMACLEAIACGVPVIGSRTLGIDEAVIHETNGLLVEPGNPSALAQTMQRLATDHPLRTKLQRGCCDIRQQFHIREYVRKLQCVYGCFMNEDGDIAPSPVCVSS